MQSSIESLHFKHTFRTCNPVVLAYAVRRTTPRRLLKTEQLPMAKACSSAARQCRELDLNVGDTIVGRETYSTGAWSEAKLTLLWMGKDVAAWNVHRRTDIEPRWRSTGEQANWTLAHRKWRRVLPRNANPVQPSQSDKENQ